MPKKDLMKDATFREHVAYHEAGHAVAATIYNTTVRASLSPDKNGRSGAKAHVELGNFFFVGSPRAQYNTKLRILGIWLAGVTGEQFSPHREKYQDISLAGGDMEDFINEVIDLFPDVSEQEIDTIAEKASSHTAKLLTRPTNREAIKQVAEALLKQETLTYEQIVRIINRARRQYWRQFARMKREGATA